jgi:hypothetical protein
MTSWLDICLPPMHVSRQTAWIAVQVSQLLKAQHIGNSPTLYEPQRVDLTRIKALLALLQDHIKDDATVNEEYRSLP